MTDKVVPNYQAQMLAAPSLIRAAMEDEARRERERKTGIVPGVDPYHLAQNA